MTLSQLHQFSGSSVQIKIDGAEALGILFFAQTGQAFITALCYLQPGRECPVIQHLLTDEELQTLSRKTHNQLLSQIDLSTRTGSFTPEEEAALRQKDDELLMERVRRVTTKAGKLKTDFNEIRRKSDANAARLRALKPGSGDVPSVSGRSPARVMRAGSEVR